MCFWDKLVSADGGKLKKAGDNGDNVSRTREYLSEFFTLIVWTGSGQHAATNFPQKDVGSHVTMNLTTSWSEGAMNRDVTLDNWMAKLPPLHEALDQLSTEYLLGSIHYNFLGRYGDGAFASKYEGIQQGFEDALDVVGDIVDARNAQLGTYRADKFNYEILHPGNCPNSINI